MYIKITRTSSSSPLARNGTLNMLFRRLPAKQLSTSFSKVLGMSLSTDAGGVSVSGSVSETYICEVGTISVFHLPTPSGFRCSI